MYTALKCKASKVPQLRQECEWLAGTQSPTSIVKQIVRSSHASSTKYFQEGKNQKKANAGSAYTTAGCWSARPCGKLAEILRPAY